VALDAKFAAALSRLIELGEADQPRATLHLSPREIIGAFFDYVRSVYRIADIFGRAQVGELQFNAWYQQWWGKLDDADRALWRYVRGDGVRQDQLHSADLIDVEISVPAEHSVTGSQSLPGMPDVRKQLVRFAAYPNRAASDVCADCLRLARRFAHDFVRDHERFLP
jgi:hypothetical protein